MQDPLSNLRLLVISALLVFWLLPLSSYLMLKGQRNENADIWFRGAWLYALVVTLFSFRMDLPLWLSGPVAQALSTASVLCFLEALRREGQVRPTPVRAYAAWVLLELGLMLALQRLGWYEDAGRSLHLAQLAVLDAWVGMTALAVRRRQGGRALYLVACVFLAFMLTNLLRVLDFLWTGQYAALLTGNWSARLGLLTNYIGGILYCYGYWGFVMEKGRTKERLAAEQAAQARAHEKSAQAQQRIAEDTLAERNALMEQVASMGKLAQSGALSAALAHEFSQPLASILLNVQHAMVLMEGRASASSVQPFLARAESETLRAADTLTQVKAMFRAGPPKLVWVDPNKVLGFVVAMMERSLHEAQVVVEIETSSRALVLFSAGQLEHVLLNLFHNAIEALRTQGAAARRIGVRTWEEDGRLLLALRDNGPGIAAGLQDSVFEMTFSTKGQHMGMGLWLARYVMERHEGQIWLAANTPGGCEFRLAMPVAALSPMNPTQSPSIEGLNH